MQERNTLLEAPAQPANGFSPLIFNNDMLVNHYRRLLHPVAAAVPRLPNGANGYNDVPDTQHKLGQRAHLSGPHIGCKCHSSPQSQRTHYPPMFAEPTHKALVTAV
uniref:Uncharacterized protein n=1 Tax=Anopheles christyi TaxID=43041 RepID=A0A182JYS1_9DIPT